MTHGSGRAHRPSFRNARNRHCWHPPREPNFSSLKAQSQDGLRKSAQQVIDEHYLRVITTYTAIERLVDLVSFAERIGGREYQSIASETSAQIVELRRLLEREVRSVLVTDLALVFSRVKLDPRAQEFLTIERRRCIDEALAHWEPSVMPERCAIAFECIRSLANPRSNSSDLPCSLR